MMDLRRLDHILGKAALSTELSDWETKFVDETTKRRERFRDRIVITDAQEEKLEQIAERAADG